MVSNMFDHHPDEENVCCLFCYAYMLVKTSHKAVENIIPWGPHFVNYK